MKTLITILALLSLTTAQAAEGMLSDLRVGNLMASNHWEPESRHTNEDHSDSFYLCYKDICGGQYEHSFNDTATLVFYDQHIYTNDWVSIRLPIGAMHGYQGYTTEEEIIPFAALTAYFPVIKADIASAGVRMWQLGKQVTAIGFEINFN